MIRKFQRDKAKAKRLSEPLIRMMNMIKDDEKREIRKMRRKQIV